MIAPAPVTLEGRGVRLEPLAASHEPALAAAAADGRLWELWFTSVPEPHIVTKIERVENRVVGFRTDNFNFASQRAIAALGARQDGVIRHHQARRDGTVRDTVVFSILAGEWPDVKRHLVSRLARHAGAGR
jgi:hypothetical protein